MVHKNQEAHLDFARPLLIVSLVMANTKPYVAAACICEKVLIEDGGVTSLVRMVDTFNLSPIGVDANVPTAELPAMSLLNPLTAFVSLKSGDLTGEHEIRLMVRKPDGTSSEAKRFPIVMGGAEHGVNVKIDVAIGQVQLGLYWFDVMWGDEVLTSIPLRLKRGEPTPQASPTQN